MKYSSKILLTILIMFISISCAIPQEIALYLFTPTPSLVPSITNTFPPSLTPFQPQTHTFTPEPSLTATLTHTPTETLTSTPTSTGTLTLEPSVTFTIPPTLTVPAYIAPTWTTAPYRSATPTRTRTSTKTSSTSTQAPGITATYTSTGETAAPDATISPSVTTNPSPSNTPRPDCSAMIPNADYTALIFSLVNQARMDNGLPKLNWDSRLAAAAARHSLDMACNSFVSHTGSDGTRASDRVRDEGYSFQWVGENIYGGWGSYGDPNNVFTWWMNSQAHRDNILGIYYKDTGVGYYLNPETGRGYFTIVFGVPK